MPKQIIQPAGLPNPGPSRAYSHGVRSGNLLFLAGQTGHDAQAEPGQGRFEAQTRRVMENLREVLAAAGAGLRDVVKTTIFLTDLHDFETVNRIYSEHFEQPYPARSTVQVPALPRGARVEIEAIARRSGADPA